MSFRKTSSETLLLLPVESGTPYTMSGVRFLGAMVTTLPQHVCTPRSVAAGGAVCFRVTFPGVGFRGVWTSVGYMEGVFTVGWGLDGLFTWGYVKLGHAYPSSQGILDVQSPMVAMVTPWLLSS